MTTSPTTGRFVRGEPANTRTLWHITNPISKRGNPLCSRPLSGPSTDSEDEVASSPWPLCPKCVTRRDAMIADAVAVLAGLAPGKLFRA